MVVNDGGGQDEPRAADDSEVGEVADSPCSFSRPSRTLENATQQKRFKLTRPQGDYEMKYLLISFQLINPGPSCKPGRGGEISATSTTPPGRRTATTHG